VLLVSAAPCQCGLLLTWLSALTICALDWLGWVEGCRLGVARHLRVQLYLLLVATCSLCERAYLLRPACLIVATKQPPYVGLMTKSAAWLCGFAAGAQQWGMSANLS
jgi:hypothetical protein